MSLETGYIPVTTNTIVETVNDTRSNNIIESGREIRSYPSNYPVLCLVFSNLLITLLFILLLIANTNSIPESSSLVAINFTAMVILGIASSVISIMIKNKEHT